MKALKILGLVLVMMTGVQFANAQYSYNNSNAYYGPANQGNAYYNQQPDYNPNNGYYNQNGYGNNPYYGNPGNGYGQPSNGYPAYSNGYSRPRVAVNVSFGPAYPAYYGGPHHYWRNGCGGYNGYRNGWGGYGGACHNGGHHCR